jgi:hypothetical protein
MSMVTLTHTSQGSVVAKRRKRKKNVPGPSVHLGAFQQQRPPPASLGPAMDNNERKHTRSNAARRKNNARTKLQDLDERLLMTQVTAARDRAEFTQKEQKLKSQLTEQTAIIDRLQSQLDRSRQLLDDLETEKNVWKQLAVDPYVYDLFSKRSFIDWKNFVSSSSSSNDAYYNDVKDGNVYSNKVILKL